MTKQQQEQNWKWGQSSANAFQLVGQFFGIVPKNLVNVKDEDAKKLIQQADASDIQVKRTQDVVQATKKIWRNQSRIGAMIPGLVRNGMQHVLTQRRQEATTTKEYAKLVTNTSVLSAKTGTAVEKTYHKGAKQIDKAGKDLNRFKGEVDEQFQTIEATATEQSNQRRIGYRDRAQKRLAANSRPWRNY
jgi:hypothetical protein